MPTQDKSEQVRELLDELEVGLSQLYICEYLQGLAGTGCIVRTCRVARIADLEEEVLIATLPGSE